MQHSLRIFFFFRAVVEIPEYVRVARSPQVVGPGMQTCTILLKELVENELLS